MTSVNKDNNHPPNPPQTQLVVLSALLATEIEYTGEIRHQHGAKDAQEGGCEWPYHHFQHHC